MMQQRVRVTAEDGLHARPAARFSQAAAQAAATVTIERDGLAPVDARSLLSVVTLGVRNGEVVTLRAEGAGAEAVVAELTALIGEPATRPSAPSDVIAAIERSRVVPTVRADDAAAAVSIARRVLAGGIPMVELTTTIPGWRDAFAELRAAEPDAPLGMGTMRSPEDAAAALDLGADFLVSPWPMPAVREVARDADRLFIEGGITPAEIADAAGRGIAKLFPSHVGGLAYLKSLLATMPEARIMATGGISADDVPRWIGAGAAAVSVGSDLYAAPDLDAAIARLNTALAGTEAAAV